jgi:hypothetical protein
VRVTAGEEGVKALIRHLAPYESSDTLPRTPSLRIMTDGTSLRDSGATDVNGLGMHPGASRGTVNAWTQTKSRIGQWLAGKTIDRILLTYDYGPLTGDFVGYVDDIEISN